MRARPAVSLALRITISVAMLGLLLWQAPDIDVDELLPEPTASTFAWLGAAAALTLAGMVLATVRWRQVLTALGLEARLGRLFSHTMAGQFVSNVLPTTIGGDVLRVARLSKDTGDSPDTFASVVLERITGWLVLPVITLVGLAVNPGLRQLGTATTVAFAVAVATLALLATTLVAVSSQRFGRRFDVRDGWRRFAGAIHLGVTRMRDRPRAALGVVAAGFAYQFVLVLSAVAAAQALGLSAAGLTALLAFFPAVLIVQVLPIGISGLGIREGAFALFLGPLGIATEEAIALGLLLYLLNLVVSLLGAPAFAIGGGAGTAGGPTPGSTPGQVPA